MWYIYRSKLVDAHVNTSVIASTPPSAGVMMNSKLQPPGHNHGTISSSGNGSNAYSQAITINIALIESIADEVAKTINNKNHAMINSSTSNNNNNNNSTVISFKPFEGSFQNS